MKIPYLPQFALVGILISGCAGTTPINNLALPPVSVIEGNITHIDDNGFILADHSGAIQVKAKLSDHKKTNFAINEKVKVYGNLEAGEKKLFDAYVIKKSTGKQMIISNPTPHFGFIMQSAFSQTGDAKASLD